MSLSELFTLGISLFYFLPTSRLEIANNALRPFISHIILLSYFHTPKALLELLPVTLALVVESGWLLFIYCTPVTFERKLHLGYAFECAAATHDKIITEGKLIKKKHKFHTLHPYLSLETLHKKTNLFNITSIHHIA